VRLEPRCSPVIDGCIPPAADALVPAEADRENPRAAAMASECRTSSGGGFAVPRLADRYGGSALNQESR
jgi:hypothetical protein